MIYRKRKREKNPVKKGETDWKKELKDAKEKIRILTEKITSLS